MLNKFRGDERLLAPAPAELERATGMAYLGLIPSVEHGLPDEDGAAQPLRRPGSAKVAAVRYPTASNLDELKPLEQVADLVWATRPSDLVGADLVVLPGSKHVAADLVWLRQQGLAEAVAAAARRGTRVLGVCGGLQMLGEKIEDAGGVDGDGVGLGLLPVQTTFERTKTTASVDVAFERLGEPWHRLSGKTFSGFEIRHGTIVATAEVASAIRGGRGFVRDTVLGISVHGAFEQPDVVAALVGSRPERHLDAVFEGLADLVEEQLDLDELARLAGVG